jgi:rhodanese-related sulfurtransferase
MNTSQHTMLEDLVTACHSFYAAFPWITAEEFRQQQDERVWHIVDVRTEVERAVSIIPGAISISDYESRINEFAGDPVLIYCTVGCRSAAYAQTLHDQGIEVYNLWGGVVDWALHGGSFATLTGTSTCKVHTHGRRWNLIPAPYIAVW